MHVKKDSVQLDGVLLEFYKAPARVSASGEKPTTKFMATVAVDVPAMVAKAKGRSPDALPYRVVEIDGEECLRFVQSAWWHEPKSKDPYYRFELPDTPEFRMAPGCVQTWSSFAPYAGESLARTHLIGAVFNPFVARDGPIATARGYELARSDRERYCYRFDPERKTYVCLAHTGAPDYDPTAPVPSDACWYGFYRNFDAVVVDQGCAANALPADLRYPILAPSGPWHLPKRHPDGTYDDHQQVHLLRLSRRPRPFDAADGISATTMYGAKNQAGEFELNGPDTFYYTGADKKYRARVSAQVAFSHWNGRAALQALASAGDSQSPLELPELVQNCCADVHLWPSEARELGITSLKNFQTQMPVDSPDALVLVGLNTGETVLETPENDMGGSSPYPGGYYKTRVLGVAWCLHEHLQTRCVPVSLSWVRETYFAGKTTHSFVPERDTIKGSEQTIVVENPLNVVENGDVYNLSEWIGDLDRFLDPDAGWRFACMVVQNNAGFTNQQCAELAAMTPEEGDAVMKTRSASIPVIFNAQNVVLFAYRPRTQEQLALAASLAESISAEPEGSTLEPDPSIAASDDGGIKRSAPSSPRGGTRHRHKKNRH